METLVIDASVAFDLERGGLLEAVFKLRYEFVTPDLLYVKELENDAIGPTLRALGLQVVELTSDEVNAARVAMRASRGQIAGPRCVRSATTIACSAAMRPCDRVRRSTPFSARGCCGFLINSRRRQSQHRGSWPMRYRRS